MRRSIPVVLVVVVGLLLLVDFVVINPTVATLASGALELVVLLAAAAALAGAATLVLRHWTDLAERRRDPLGSGVLLAGFAVMLLAGFYPGSTGASDPAVRWLVAALLAPLIAALFAMLFVFLLSAARNGLALRTRQTAVMLVAAMVVTILLLPIGGSRRPVAGGHRRMGDGRADRRCVPRPFDRRRHPGRRVRSTDPAHG